MATKPDLLNGAGLVADRGGSGITLQGLRGVQSRAILPQFAQQSRRDFGAGPRERAEQVMVGVLGKKLFDLLAISLQLRLQHPQLFSTRDGQAALRLGQGLRSAKSGGLRKELERVRVTNHMVDSGAEGVVTCEPPKPRA